MNVIIFDDSNKDAVELENALVYCFNKMNIEANIELHNSISYDIDFKDFDLVFLDIELGDKNGIEFGKHIRSIKPNITLVLTTNFKQYALDGYKIKADRYYLKPIDRNELYIELKDVLEDFIGNHKYYLDDKISFNKIYFKDVIYVEKNDSKTYIHLIGHRPIESNKTLKEWLDIFNTKNFCIIQRTCFVNLTNIKSYRINEITMINNVVFPVSRNYKDSFKDAYTKYILRGM